MTEQSLGNKRLMLSFKQKYEQITAEKSDSYYEKYCEAMKENERLHGQLTEYEKRITFLETQIECLLENVPTNSKEDNWHDLDPNITVDSHSEPD